MLYIYITLFFLLNIFFTLYIFFILNKFNLFPNKKKQMKSIRISKKKKTYKENNYTMIPNIDISVDVFFKKKLLSKFKIIIFK